MSSGLLYPASNAIDGNIHTLAVSRKRQGNWISVLLPSGTAVQYVALYNRVDLEGSWPAQLGTFEVWVGAAEGDTSSQAALMCATVIHRSPVIGVDSKPYMVDCGGIRGHFVTVKQTGPPRHLVIAELKVYA